MPALYRAALTGSNSALGELLQRFRDELLQQAEAELPADLRQKVSPSDVVQISLAEGANAFHQFDGENGAPFKAWLIQILRRNILDAVRHYRLAEKRDVRREQPLDGDKPRNGTLEHFTAPGPSPLSGLLLDEKRACVLAAIQNLPENDRTIILMRNVEVLSFDEIAQKLGISAEAARKRWQRAIQRLSVHLAPLQDSSICEPR